MVTRKVGAHGDEWLASRLYFASGGGNCGLALKITVPLLSAEVLVAGIQKESGRLTAAGLLSPLRRLCRARFGFTLNFNLGEIGHDKNCKKRGGSESLRHL